MLEVKLLAHFLLSVVTNGTTSTISEELVEGHVSQGQMKCSKKQKDQVLGMGLVFQ
jgi:hypothetical protein